MIDLSNFLVVPVLLAGALLIRGERRRAVGRRIHALERQGFVVSEIQDRAEPVLVLDRANGRVAVVSPEGTEILERQGAG